MIKNKNDYNDKAKNKNNNNEKCLLFTIWIELIVILLYGKVLGSWVWDHDFNLI